jgi:hypothetical protein
VKHLFLVVRVNLDPVVDMHWLVSPAKERGGGQYALRKGKKEETDDGNAHGLEIGPSHRLVNVDYGRKGISAEDDERNEQKDEL